MCLLHATQAKIRDGLLDDNNNYSAISVVSEDLCWSTLAKDCRLII